MTLPDSLSLQTIHDFQEIVPQNFRFRPSYTPMACLALIAPVTAPHERQDALVPGKRLVLYQRICNTLMLYAW